ncbi:MULTISPECIES: hypothetical protein [Sphingomonadaceae]|uniref:hypothetical protein n=1 Tax=Sphingomonadales TaxID=204457 RepID=UPI00076FEB29|nr:hypothetical protein [Sphingobium sp. TKS]AMK23211.1 hypothetical protein K426_11365 [Sphingobium sp. TKS]MCF8709110.1 hypothetical protein [Rhizorhapis sp. SPR117]
MSKKPVVDKDFVDAFNLDLTRLGSVAQIAITNLTGSGDVFELLDDEGQFVTLLPVTATPEVTAAAYRLYGQGLNRGLRAGEELAWSKLRHLIGAAGKD